MAKQRKIKGLCLVLILLMLCAQTAQAAHYATIRPGAVGHKLFRCSGALIVWDKAVADGGYGLQTPRQCEPFSPAQRLTLTSGRKPDPDGAVRACTRFCAQSAITDRIGIFTAACGYPAL